VRTYGAIRVPIIAIRGPILAIRVPIIAIRIPIDRVKVRTYGAPSVRGEQRAKL
jgi:hypothetical protein